MVETEAWAEREDVEGVVSSQRQAQVVSVEEVGLMVAWTEAEMATVVAVRAGARVVVRTGEGGREAEATEEGRVVAVREAAVREVVELEEVKAAVVKAAGEMAVEVTVAAMAAVVMGVAMVEGKEVEKVAAAMAVAMVVVRAAAGSAEAARAVEG